MGHAKSREVVLSINATEELVTRLNELRDGWKKDAGSILKGITCSESKEGHFVLMAAESAFTTIPGACVIKGIGAIQLVGTEPVFEEGASSKNLVLRHTEDGWKFSVKFVPPIIRDRNRK